MQQKTSLSDRCREIILGSLLGDGSLKIHKPYVNARFSFRHSVHQEEYFWWKVGELKEISSENNVWAQGENGKDGWGGKKLRYQSRALPELTQLYRLTHKKHQLRIRRKWLNLLTPLSLAVWWCDDGSIIGNGRRGVLCTDGFDYDTQKILAQYIQVVWKVKVHVAAVGRKREGKREVYWRLWFRSAEELKKFLRIILPHVFVPSMLPKVLILYKDSELQQRWISEVIHRTKFPRDIVEKHLTEKKLKWKHFRE